MSLQSSSSAGGNTLRNCEKIEVDVQCMAVDDEEAERHRAIFLSSYLPIFVRTEDEAHKRTGEPLMISEGLLLVPFKLELFTKPG